MPVMINAYARLLSVSAITFATDLVTTDAVATVPAGNSGDIRFNNVTTDGTGTHQYRKNVGVYTLITEDLVINLANGDTLKIRLLGPTPPEAASVEVMDQTTSGLITLVDLSV